MPEMKYFCRRASEFRLSELELDEADLKLITPIFKRQSSFVAAARSEGKEFLVRRLEGKAFKLSELVYEKIDKAGYIRHFNDSKNFSLLEMLFDSVRSYGDKCTNTAKTKHFVCYGWAAEGEDRWSWAKDQDERDERIRVLCRLNHTILNTAIMCKSTKEYETYDIDKLDDIAAKILQRILTPRQREMIEWLSSARSLWFYRKGMGSMKVLTEEEWQLYNAALCNVLANAYDIRDELCNAQEKQHG